MATANLKQQWTIVTLDTHESLILLPEESPTKLHTRLYSQLMEFSVKHTLQRQGYSKMPLKSVLNNVFIFAFGDRDGGRLYANF